MGKGLGMNITAMDPYASAAVASSASVTLVPSLDELLPSADFLTIHTPLIASTKGMISTAELSKMKKGSRILNVARGGTIDEVALLAALESGHLAGAGIDVFTSEPPQPDSSAAKLIAHPAVVATPHLGASTKEAQENVSIDVCEQVLQILAGELPRSAVNAPLILPEEYMKLQPYVNLIEKMGSLYTQHYTSSDRPALSSNRDTFDLIYEGDVASINNTKPLFAALIKGLTAPISSGGNVNIVNAELVARERGIIVNERRSREPSSSQTYSSLVTLVSHPPSRASSRAPPGSAADTSTSKSAPQKQQIISGTCSASRPIISRLDRFWTSFVPEDRLLICHNYDSPGKVGLVGSILGRQGVNINFMSVAKGRDNGNGVAVKALEAPAAVPEGEEEALMILGVDREVEESVVNSLKAEGGILSASIITL